MCVHYVCICCGMHAEVMTIGSDLLDQQKFLGNDVAKIKLMMSQPSATHAYIAYIMDWSGQQLNSIQVEAHTDCWQLSKFSYYHSSSVAIIL